MNALNELKKWMIENNDDDTPLHPSDIYKKIDELIASQPSGGKSAEDVEQWYHQWMNDRGKRRVAPGEALTLLKDFASQYAHQQPVNGYSREQVNEAMDKIETMEALENTMKPQYQQPINDGWVRVEDALPKKDGDSQIYCLCFDKDYNGVRVLPYNEYHKCWDQEDADDYYTKSVGGSVTHWRTLPEPPK